MILVFRTLSINNCLRFYIINGVHSTYLCVQEFSEINSLLVAAGPALVSIVEEWRSGVVDARI